MYQLVHDGQSIKMIVGGAVAAWIPVDPHNRDYQRYQAWLAEGNTPDPADPIPDAEPSRDERLLAAVDSAKAAVAGSKSFTSEQAAVLAAVFDGLGQAITGGRP